MQISKQFLLDAVGLVLTVSLIMTGVHLFRRTERTIQKMQYRQTRQLETLEEYDAVKYDGYQVDGATAFHYVKNMVGDYGIPITITTVAGSVRITERSQYASMRDTESKAYLNPFEQFLCEVQRDENDAIVGANLTSVGKGETK